MSRQQRFILEIECKLDDEYFEVWNELTEEIKEFWNSGGTVPCEGTGNMRPYCEDCQYCRMFDLDED